MESRQNISVGQEVISADLNKIPSRIERGFLDYVLFQMMGKTENAFFQDSFLPTYLSSITIQIKAGMGIQTLDTGISEPTKKPLYLATDTTIEFDAPDSSNPRIDLVVVKALIANGAEETRYYKSAETNEIEERDFVVYKKWSTEMLVVKGTAAPVPVSPTIPAGYLEIAKAYMNASTGMSGQSDVTDSRSKMPFCTSTESTGSSEYDAIVGTVPQANYSSLKDALDNASDGWKILVLSNDVIDSGEIPTISNDSIEIVFKNGVSLTKGTATVGMIVDADYCKIVNSRFIDFITGGDFAIRVSAGAKFTNIDSPRFNNCASNIDDLGDNTINNVEIVE